MSKVYITRGTKGETINGKPRPDRVYVTDPHIGEGIYSSTEKKEHASTFERDEAERLLALGRWHHLAPEIEKA